MLKFTVYQRQFESGQLISVFHKSRVKKTNDGHANTEIIYNDGTPEISTGHNLTHFFLMITGKWEITTTIND
jgi:hypothetical protein